MEPPPSIPRKAPRINRPNATPINRYCEGSGDKPYQQCVRYNEVYSYPGDSSHSSAPPAINPQIIELEKKLLELFGAKCRVHSLLAHDKHILINFANGTTLDDLKKYTGILKEYNFEDKDIEPHEAVLSFNGTVEHIPATLRLEHSSIDELRAKLGCEQQLTKCPDERDQQLVKYYSCRP